MTAAALALDAAAARSTRDAILDAAERLFADRGFAGAPVREIVADAGLRNQASLYYHFPSKHALYEAVVRRGVGAMMQVVDEEGAAAGLRGRTPRERAASVAAYIDAMIDFLLARPHLARLIQRAALDDDEFVRRALPPLVAPLFEQGVRVLSYARGPWQPDELPHLAAGLYHLIFGYFANASLLRSLLGDDPAGGDTIARQRQFLKHAAIQLLGAEEPRRRRPEAT
jgi:TetR/AcrR family transcriptional regulator